MRKHWYPFPLEAFKLKSLRTELVEWVISPSVVLSAQEFGIGYSWCRSPGWQFRDSASGTDYLDWGNIGGFPYFRRYCSPFERCSDCCWEITARVLEPLDIFERHGGIQWHHGRQQSWMWHTRIQLCCGMGPWLVRRTHSLTSLNWFSLVTGLGTPNFGLLEAVALAN